MARSSDILQFAANRTSDGILRLSDYGMVTFLEQNVNVMYLGLFDEGVPIVFAARP